MSTNDNKVVVKDVYEISDEMTKLRRAVVIAAAANLMASGRAKTEKSALKIISDLYAANDWPEPL